MHARLAALYPEYNIAHMPADAIQGFPRACGTSRALAGDAVGSAPAAASAAEPGEAPVLGTLAVPGGSADAEALAAEVMCAAGSAQRESPESITDAEGGGAAPRPLVRCAAFVGNAAVAGDAFAYHVDADPAAFPDSPWRMQCAASMCHGYRGCCALHDILLQSGVLLASLALDRSKCSVTYSALPVLRPGCHVVARTW